MSNYSTRSSDRLETCVPPIQIVCRELVREFDNSVICGYRNAWDQNQAYLSKNSKVQWPNSKHNEYESEAIDLVPYPTMWDDINQFYIMAGHILSIAKRHGIKLRWGGDWDSDGDLTDQKFMDLGHWEFVGYI